MLPSSVRIFVCTVPQDMRRSFDSLALVTKEALRRDPMDGSLYVFIGKRPTRVKVLWWDRNGYCLLAKRLHRALFLPPEAASEECTSVQIDAAALTQLLAGVARGETRRKYLT